jgi:hypothetical protein
MEGNAYWVATVLCRWWWFSGFLFGGGGCPANPPQRQLIWFFCVFKFVSRVFIHCSMSAVTSSFSIDEFGGLSREQLVYLARTAEASERFEGMSVSAHGGVFLCSCGLFSDAQANFNHLLSRM